MHMVSAVVNLVQRSVCVLGIPNSHAYSSAPYGLLAPPPPPLDSMDCGCRLLVDEATLNLYM